MRKWKVWNLSEKEPGFEIVSTHRFPFDINESAYIATHGSTFTAYALYAWQVAMNGWPSSLCVLYCCHQHHTQVLPHERYFSGTVGILAVAPVAVTAVMVVVVVDVVVAGSCSRTGGGALDDAVSQAEELSSHRACEPCSSS